MRSVRSESWKYARYPHGDGRPDRHMAELYNIEFDPEERARLLHAIEAGAEAVERGDVIDGIAFANELLARREARAR